jgi:hypothetical protein
MFYIFLTHLKRFLDNLMCHLVIMFINILKKIIFLRNKDNLDARFWVQRVLLNKNFKDNYL